MVLGVIVGFLSMYPMLIMQKAIDYLMITKNINLFIKYAIIYILMYFFAYLFKVIVYNRGEILELELMENIRIDLLEKVLSSKLNILENLGESLVYQKLIEDIKEIDGNIMGLLLDFSASISSFVVGFGILLYYDKLILLLIFPLSIITTLVIKFSFSRSNRYSIDSQDMRSSISDLLFEGITGARDLILYEKDEDYINSFKTNASKLKEIDKKRIHTKNISQVVINFAFNFLIGMIILIGGIRIRQAKLTIGALVAIIMYNSMITDPIFNVIDNQKEFLQIKNAIKRIDNIVKKLQVRDDKNKVSLESICINNISLVYGSNIVLKNFNFKIKKGDIIKIDGRTGSGKSSLAKLITGLYLPSGGVISINGSSNNKVKTSTVFQTNKLFNKSIEDNIKFGREIDETVYEKIISITKVNEIIKKYNDSLVGSAANKLSGGEKTRILVARALANESDLYIFDEISTGLDNELFNEIVKDVIEFLNGKTLIFIDHHKIDLKYFTKNILI